MSFPPYALQNAATRAAVAAFKNKASADLLRGARADRAPPAGSTEDAGTGANQGFAHIQWETPKSIRT